MKIKLAIIIVLCTIITSFSQEKSSVEQPIFKKISINNTTPEILSLLGNNGIDLECGAIINENKISLELTRGELHILDDLNIQYNIDINNLTKFYSERATADMPKAIREFKAERAKSLQLKAKGFSNKSISELFNNVGQHTGENEIDWVQPVNWNLNPNILNEDNLSDPSNTTPHFGGCLTHDQVLQELDDMRTYSINNGLNIISEKLDASPKGQKTLEGRTVYYVRISDNPDVDEAEPETLYQSLIHSREAASVMLQLYYMWYILENYNSDPAIRSLVNNQELYFIPIFNPDGFVYNQTQAPNGGGGQRKNRNTTGSCSTYLEGIDLNRNSAYYWGNGGSSTDSCNDTYMGIGPFSENETQIMSDFFILHDFKLALNHHSYKNAMLHAYAGVNQTYPIVDGNSTLVADMYSKYNHDMTYYNRYMHGPSTQVTSLNSGNMNDWMLGGVEDTNVRGVSTDPSYPFPSPNVGSGKFTLAWTPENGLYSEGSSGPGGSYQGFWPAPSLYDDIARRAMRANFMAAYFSGKYAKLHDMTPSNISADGNLTFGLENLGRTASDFTITVIPISGLATVGAAVSESGMNVLEQRNVNIAYTLSAGIQANDKIEYKVTLTNDYASDNVLYEATIVKYYQPTELVIDNPDTDNLTNWFNSGWSTTGVSYSGSTALSSGSYTTSATRNLQLNGVYDFTNGTEFLIQYYAKWDLERSFDYVQIEASTNGSTWTPLIGKYTKPGAPDANNNYSQKSTTDDNFQPDYQHLYDGDTAGKWVMEEITVDTSNNSAFFNQSTVYLRFKFRSDSNNRQDSYVNADFEGFQLDDFRILKIQEPCVLSVPTGLATVPASITSSGATLNWTNIPSATYDIRYKSTASSAWLYVNDVATNSYTLTGLDPATMYEFQVQSKCDTDSGYTIISYEFKTLEPSYCASSGDISTRGITDVTFIGETTFTNLNSNTDPGYTDYTSTHSSDVNIGQGGYNLSVTVDPGIGNNTLYTSVFIDDNGDGFFDRNFDLGMVTKDKGSLPLLAISIPTTAGGAGAGLTRMRIATKLGSSPTSCETFANGEVEDYALNIIDTSLGIQDELLSTFNLYPNPSGIGEIKIKLPNEIQEFSIEISNVLGQRVLYDKAIHQTNKIHTINTTKFKSGVYIITIATNLGRATKKIIIE